MKFFLDHGPKLLIAHAAVEEAPVYQEAGSALDVESLSFRKLSLYGFGSGARIKASVKGRAVEAERPGVLFKLSYVQLLGREQHIVILPELALRRSAMRRFGSLLGVSVHRQRD